MGLQDSGFGAVLTVSTCNIIETEVKKCIKGSIHLCKKKIADDKA